MKPFVVAALVVTLAGMVGSAWAADDKAKLSGTWKWTVAGGNSDRTTTLKLNLDGDKLTGAILGRNNAETKIEGAKFKDGTVSFKVTRDRNGAKTVTEYEGRLSGDTIKGKRKIGRDGQTNIRDWEAKRSE